MPDMSASSKLDLGLVAAYRRTLFQVTGGSEPFTLQIDVPSAALDALHRANQVASSAFMTALNPRSELLADAENRRRQAELTAYLEERGLRWLSGIGVDPDSAWPGEESVLVLGMGYDVACEAGRHFGQNAIVWCSDAAIPHLVLLE